MNAWKLSLVTVLLGGIITMNAMAQEPGTQFAPSTDNEYNYWVYLPETYDGDTDHPLIIFLHGAGERGDDLARVKVHGPPKLVSDPANASKYPELFSSIVVSPQCPENHWWHPKGVKSLIDEVLSRYNVDRKRIYLTGLSMGGFGTFTTTSEYSSLFAAAAPVCGGGDVYFFLKSRMQGEDGVVTDPVLLAMVELPPAQAKNLIDVPLWVFHGDADRVVPLEQSQIMVDAISAKGGDVKLTVYPDVGHDSWTETYANPELYKWFYSHTK